MKAYKVVVAAVLGGLASLATAHAKLNVVCTTPDLGALAREIGGPLVEVRSIGRPNENPHFVEAKPSYIVALNRADVLIEVGLELEIGWLPALLDQTRNAKIRKGSPGRLNAGTVIQPLEVPAAAVDRSMGDVHASGNPHYMMDPERAKIVAQAIADRFAKVDVANAGAYADNLKKLLARIEAAEADAKKLLEPYRGAKIVTYHKSLSYLADRYALNVVNTVEPKPGIAPSPSHIAALIDQMKADKVKAVLMEPWYDRSVPELLAEKTGAKVVIVPLLVGGEPETQDYPSLVKLVAKRVAQTLGGGP